jgi:hypothetical protein
LPTTTPYAFTKAFAEQKEQEWKRFLTRNNLPEPCGNLAGLIEMLMLVAMCLEKCSLL